MFSKYIPTVQQIAVSAFTVLCLVLTLFVSILCSDLVQTGAVTLNIRYLPSRNEVTEYVASAPSYYYTPAPPVAPVPPALPDGFIYPPENPDTKDLEFDWSPPVPQKEADANKVQPKKAVKKGDGSI